MPPPGEPTPPPIDAPPDDDPTRIPGPPDDPIEDPTGDTIAVALEWNAPATCPQGERVRQVIATLLARKVAIDPSARVIVRGDIAPVGARWLLQLSVDDHGTIEQRRLEADRCETLADAAGLVVATGIDPRRVSTTLAQAPERTRGRSDRPSTREPGGRRKVRVGLGVASGPALGFTPKLAAWLQGDVTLLIGRARVGAQVGHAFARDTGGDPGAEVRNTSGTLRGCFAPTQRKISLPVCGLVELGATFARGRGDAVMPENQRSLWAALGLGAGIEYAPIRRLALVAQVDALVALRRPQFHVATPTGQRERVFFAAPAGVRLVLGVSLRLP